MDRMGSKRSIVIVFALAGCGRDDAKAARSATPDPRDPMAATATGKKPCEYIARADAEAAVGLPLPKTTENVTLGICDYNTAEFYGSSFSVGDWDGVNAAAQSGRPSHPPQTVSGVGDEAVNLGGNLYVRKGDRGFLLVLNGPAVDRLPDKGLARAKALALKILPNL
jgi:hypothetical protein